MYAIAAGAAGVSLLALAQPMEGKIIYTKANRYIGPNTTAHLDLNHDHIADFDLKNAFTATSFGAFGRLSALPHRQKNAVQGHMVSPRAYASALSANVRVGPKGPFLPRSGLMAATYTGGPRFRYPGSRSCSGPWANVTNRYLGLKFVIQGKTHFGWARLNVSCANAKVSARLTGYAYETIPNKPIIAGKTGPDDGITLQSGSLGHLAAGASAIPAWRLKQTAATTH
jgi:hypothetical protein